MAPVVDASQVNLQGYIHANPLDSPRPNAQLRFFLIRIVFFHLFSALSFCRMASKKPRTEREAPMVDGGAFDLPNDGYGPFGRRERTVIFDWCKVEAVVKSNKRGQPRRLKLKAKFANATAKNFRLARAIATALCHLNQGENSEESQHLAYQSLLQILQPHTELEEINALMRYLVGLFESGAEGGQDEQDDPDDEPEDFPLDEEPPTNPYHRGSSSGYGSSTGVSVSRTTLAPASKAVPKPSQAPGLQTEPPSRVATDAHLDSAGFRTVDGGYIHTIRITTVGLEDLPGVDTRDYRWNDANEKQIIEAFCKKYPDDPKPSLYLDARCFHEPRCEEKHTGELDNFLLALTEHPEMKNWWLKYVKGSFVYNNRFNDEYSDVESCYMILVACKAGINRSVGCASLLKSIFEDLGIHVEPTLHGSRRKWRSRSYCDHCSRCRCDQPSFLKKEAARKAIRLWHTL